MGFNSVAEGLSEVYTFPQSYNAFFSDIHN
jgi:hypothetical protein